jgi:hypothetical protein
MVSLMEVCSMTDPQMSAYMLYAIAAELAGCASKRPAIGMGAGSSAGSLTPASTAAHARRCSSLPPGPSRPKLATVCGLG